MRKKAFDSNRRAPRNDRAERTTERRENRVAEPRSSQTGRTDLLFGFLPVLERMRSRPGSIAKIYAVEGATEHRLREVTEIARKNRIVVERVGRDVLDRMAEKGVNHQGLIAVATAADFADADAMVESANAESLFVILDGVEDPRNFGAILRSAECAGADGVFIPERRAVGLTDTVAKSSAGAVEYVKVGRVQNINRLIEDLKEKNVWVVGTSGDAEMNYTDWDWTQASALVLGGEGSGLHRLVAENCDVLVKIPMYGKIESLNVSVAAGVVLFEARRQRAVGNKQ
jgi:23S rRNA (guanosine2251-2'-O)-methyltransferase